VDPSELSHELDALRRAGLTVCPTIIVFERGTQGSLYRTGSFEHEEYVSQTLLDTWNDLWPIARDDPDFIWETWSELVTMLHETGISLMVGTDLSVPGIIPGFSVHQEMELWQEAGIPAADVLRSATLVPAQFVGVEDRLGTIEEGKTASMVLLRANPLEDIANASEIEGVFLRGEYFDRSALDGLLDKARGAAGG